MMLKQRRWQWLWVMVLLLLTWWLGARGLTADSLWSDEWSSLKDTGAGHYGPRNLYDIWVGVAQRNPWHAPGYFMMLNGWGRLVGWSPEMLRALALLAGMLAVAMTYRAGRDMVSPRVGIFAAAILTTSAFFVNYLHELRVYMFLTLMSVLVIWLYWKLVYARRAPPVWAWVLLGLTVTVYMYQHYFALIVLGAMGIYHLFFAPKNRRWWIASGAVTAGGLLFLPWFNNMLAGLRGTAGVEGLNDRALNLVDALHFLSTLFSSGDLVLLVLTSLFVVTALFRCDSKQRERRMLIVMSVASIFLLLVLNQFVEMLTINRMRYLLVLWPLAALVTSIGIDQLAEAFQRRLNRPRVGSAAGLLLLGVWMIPGVINTFDADYIANFKIDSPGFHYLPAKAIPELLLGRIQPDDDVIVYLTSTVTRDAGLGIINYYMGNFPAHYIAPDWHLDADDLNGTTRAWVVSTLEDYGAPDVRVAEDSTSALADTYEYCGTAARNTLWNVALFQRLPGCCPAQTTADSTVFDFGEGIRVTGFAVQPVNPYGELPVQVAWSLADDAPFQNYSTTLEIAPVGGEKIAQKDYGLPYGFRCKTTEIDVRSLPPGSYEVRLGVYPWRTGVRVQGTNTATGTQSDLMSIGTFTLP